MNIVENNNHRVLIKENQTEVSINDGDILQYTGIYYKQINDIVRTVEIETTFVGVVESSKYRYDSGTTGIYVKPLYIWDIVHNEWYKIVGLTIPQTKYFKYPHLLSLPNHSQHCSPLQALNNCENKSLDDFVDVAKPFYLDNFM